MVGGAVRNALLGLPHGDIDIATTALPHEVMRRAQAAGFKAVPTGIDHGTVTVVIEGRPFEVTTLREDVETFGRHATVRFGRDWKRDAERRDFTMNALSLSRRRHGARLCRRAGGSRARAACASSAMRRRASARTICASCASSASTPATAKAHPDAAGLHAAIVARAGLEQLSRERVRMELMKLLVAPHAVAGAGRDGGGGPARHGARRRAAISLASPTWRSVEAALGLAPDAARRLGALGAWIVEDAERLWQRLRLSNAEHERLAAMATEWWRVSPAMGEGGARAALPARAGALHRARAARLGALRMPGATMRRGAISRRCRSAGPRRVSAARRPTSSRAASRKGPALGAALGAGRGGLDRGGVSDGPAKRSSRSSMQRWAD